MDLLVTFAILDVLSLTNAFGGMCSELGDGTTGSSGNSFEGEVLPGGLKGLLIGEEDRLMPGVVVCLEARMDDAGLTGGSIEPSWSQTLDRRLAREGEGEGDIETRVSAVLSDSDNRGFLFSLSSLISEA